MKRRIAFSEASAEQLTEIKVGNIVTFGSYNQDNNPDNDAKPIEWQVLEVKDDGSCVLMSVYGLEAKRYNEELTDVTWETCSLRAWLNGEFYRTAFTEKERKAIVTVTNKNADNAAYGIPSGNDTEDNVWLLSLDDVCRYYEGIGPGANPRFEWDWGNGEQLIAKATETAVAHGAHPLSQEDVDTCQAEYDYPLQVGASCWWLRSPGSYSGRAACVSSEGDVVSIGYHVDLDYAMARPVVVVAPGF